MKKPYVFRHNAEEKRYELEVGGEQAVVEYIRDGEVLFLTHTYVPEHLEGRGIGSELVRSVLEDVRERGLRIVPLCPFVAVWINRHPDWEPLMKND